MIIKNAANFQECFSEKDLYIFTIGYEHRSYYLYDYVMKNFPENNVVLFVYDDYQQFPHTNEIVSKLVDSSITFYKIDYSKSAEVQEIISKRVSDLIQENDSITIHIDYSSMPRSWYCKLPVLLGNIIRKTDKVYFWYVEGLYPPSHMEYPSSGIDSFSFFSGRPSLEIDNNRIHVLSLGYDVIRTQAILSITDPGYLVSCFAYDRKRKDLLECIEEVNGPIFARSAMKISLHLEDFEFMVSKLCEITTELLSMGDVILIPDGPKPLIFAMSLIPDLLNKDGITCLHVTRNKECFEPVDVMPTDVVCGFCICDMD